ncbi:NAC domain [Macleaya cordata]|uniref:NAC domain n=1 Tax=Macleaya cordata TaxID=56857 RepID=A0A200QYY1_MACCD|nr:NAC domain [Macleaya cordata]
MGDLKNPKEPPISLPPGFRFHPTEHQLFSFYLCNKNKRNPNLSLPTTSKTPISGLDAIQEIDLYNYDPCDLPEISSFCFGQGGSKKDCYCFSVKKMGSEDSKRKAKGGFWKCKGRPRNVMGGSEGAVLGTKWTFVFYRGNSSRSSNRTNWVMIEYALVDNRKDSFVLCRVFLKSGGKKRADHVPLSYGEGSIATTPNILSGAPCKKRDAPSTSGIDEVVAHEDMLLGKDSGIEKSPSKSTGEPNDVVIAQRVSDSGFGSSMGIPQSDQLVNSDGLISSGIISYDAMEDDLLTDPMILEGNFIELNDLVSPLVGIDSWEGFKREESIKECNGTKKSWQGGAHQKAPLLQSVGERFNSCRGKFSISYCESLFFSALLL